MAVNRWKIQKVNIQDVKPFPDNPRSISKKALSGLKNSLARFGYVEPIVWNETTGHIIGGHQRYAILLQEGVKRAYMVVVSMSPEEEMAANLTLNNPEIEGEWDDPVMDLLMALEASSPDLFSELNMDSLRKEIESKMPKISEGTGDEDTPPDTDTKCPCCGHEFKVESKDVTVVDLSKESK